MSTVSPHAVNYFPIAEHLFTAIIAIPCILGILLHMIQLSKSCVRASTQLNVHCIAWILYMLFKWKNVDAFFNEYIFQLTIVFHLCFTLLLPWAVLAVTIDRCVSLGFPTYYNLFNGETVRTITVIVSSCMICLNWYWIHSLVIRKDSIGTCYMVECFNITNFINWFIVYKVVFGLTNLIVFSVFIYLCLNYQRRGRGQDKIKNILMFIILIAGFLFNVLPPLAYYFIRLFGKMKLIRIFGPLVFTCINLDGIVTVIVYIAFYKLKEKKAQQFKLKQAITLQLQPVICIKLAERSARQTESQSKCSS